MKKKNTSATKTRLNQTTQCSAGKDKTLMLQNSESKHEALLTLLQNGGYTETARPMRVCGDGQQLLTAMSFNILLSDQ